MVPVHVPMLKKTIPLVLIQTNSTFIVSIIIYQRSFSPAFLVCFIKYFLPSITFLRVCHFFFISFSLHTFCGLVRACGNLCEPCNVFFFVHSLECLFNNSLISDFSQACVITSPMHALSAIPFSA